MAKKITDLTDVRVKSVRGKNNKKVVQVKSKTTRSGIDSCRSDERTLKLYEATSLRSGRLNRIMKTSGISSSKRLSEITGMPPGAMGRMIRGDSCLSTSGCFQVQYGLWNNMATGVITEEEDNMSGNKKLYMRSGYMVGSDDTDPIVVVNDGLKLPDLLKDLLSQYDGLVGSCLTGLIPSNNNVEEALDKTQLVLFLILDLFTTMFSNAWIAFIDDNTIMGCVDMSNNRESLNEKICVVQCNPESSMVARKVFIQNTFMLFRPINGGDHGTFILKKDAPIYKIGEVFLTLENIHRNIIEKAMRLNKTSGEQEQHSSNRNKFSGYNQHMIYPDMHSDQDTKDVHDSFTLSDPTIDSR